MSSIPLRHLAGLTPAIVLLTLTAGCAPAGRPGGYTPRVRELTVTTVPLLVKEAQTVYPFLAGAFARGGVLDGKEVYGFSPSTLVAVEGDTIHFTLVNPEDDAHTFVLPDLAVALPGQQVTRATYIARRAGIYSIICNVPTHMPMMSGQLVVLAPDAVSN